MQKKKTLETTVLFHTTLSGVSTPGQSEAGSEDNEGVLCISRISSITGTSLSDYLVSYPGHLFGAGSYPYEEM